MIGSLENPPIIVKSDNGQSLVLAALSLGFVVAGAWMVKTGSIQQVMIAWGAIAFFGVCGVVLLLRLIRPATLTLSADGLSYRNLMRFRTVLWEDIAEFRTLQFNSSISCVGINYVPGRAPPTTGYDRLNSGLSGMDETLTTGWELDTDNLRDLLDQALAKWGRRK